MVGEDCLFVEFFSNYLKECRDSKSGLIYSQQFNLDILSYFGGANSKGCPFWDFITDGKDVTPEFEHPDLSGTNHRKLN